MLAGTKRDVYVEDLDKSVPKKDADKVAKSIGAYCHLRVSSLEDKNVKEIFMNAILASLEKDKLLSDVINWKRAKKNKISCIKYMVKHVKVLNEQRQAVSGLLI